ncbi:MAG TPA: alpha-ketoacid dehydrogenase subunit beta [Gammaproteobacteria bacterium]|nr:alpha-ketoacid dehydrogenase subunit beta [Gammaproteobacteria bacterium]HBF09482.1 alpha-ketoacid dehydrogenase subunit beta [Gammaproteobacteria bacterium]HCK91886.1 alpha-ketoacid dehydrogenase subunit beta [Gammaproteobacteria bacterium]|tara:strand:- start:127 stop:1131 length:1005 start_codon:yes stop_codon:yes gene_type:complete
MIKAHQTHEATMVDALNLALKHALAEDENVVLLGEDIGTNGGVFRVTEGLKDIFGVRRIMDTPLAETIIAGMSVGMATQGLRPVAEIQFMGFIYSTVEHIVSHATRLRNRTRGRLTCPLVIRAPFGGGIHAPEHHSESTEAMFGHIPGLRVVIPSSPVRAYGLLLSAIRCNDPVLFLEPKRVYRSVKQNLVDNGEGLPLDSCFILREGNDLTLISWGAMIQETLQAAAALEKQYGISVEVVDVASIKPLDSATIIESVKKTGRAVIVHEAAKTYGPAGEIIARIQEEAFFHLRAPVGRVTGFDIPMPYFKNEAIYMPDIQQIVEQAQTTLQQGQ